MNNEIKNDEQKEKTQATDQTQKIENNEKLETEQNFDSQKKVEENTDSLKQMEKISGDILSLNESILSNVNTNSNELRESIQKSDKEITENIKELIIRLDAINETISILPETNDHIKTAQSNISDANANILEKFEKLNTIIEKIPFDLKEKMEEQKNVISDIGKGINDNNLKIIEKLDSFLSNLNDLVLRISEITDFEKAINEKREAEFKMTQSKLYNERGLVLFYRGIFTSALNYFQKAHSLDESSPEIINNIGQTYMKLKDYKKAEESFVKAIEIFPDFSEVYNNLGMMYMENNNYELAMEKFRKAIDLYSDFSEAYNNLGNALFSAKKIDEAIKNWEKALELNPFLENAKEKLKIYKKGEINA